MVRLQVKEIAVEAKDMAELGGTEMCGAARERVNYRLELARGPANHLKHVADSRLILSGSVSSLVRACTSSKRPTSLIAITA